MSDEMQRIRGLGNQGPYSQGVIVGPWVYTSGQIPLIPETGVLVSPEITAQTRQALTNLQSILQQCGVQLTDVVKVTIYLTDLAHFALVNGVYAEFFSTDLPARSCVQVAALPKGVGIEVEAIAYRE